MNIIIRECNRYKLLAFIILIFGSVSTLSQTPADPNPKRKATIVMARSSIDKVIAALAQEYEISVGWEKSKFPEDNCCVDVSVRSESLEKTLKQIEMQTPEYRWEFKNGVLSVTPLSRGSDMLKALLGTELQKARVIDCRDSECLRNTIWLLPEIQSFAFSNHLARQRFANDRTQSLLRWDAEDISEYPMSLRRLLNMIVVKSNHRIWSMEQIQGKKGIIALCF